jgi:hypothetical protein
VWEQPIVGFHVGSHLREGKLSEGHRLASTFAPHSWSGYTNIGRQAAGRIAPLVSSRVAVLEEVMLLLFNRVTARSFDHNRFLVSQSSVLQLQVIELLLQFCDPPL